MERLKNSGLNYSILPNKLDITQILVEFRKYERAAIWQKFHQWRQDNREFEEHIIKKGEKN